jgi:hypothetical protein
LVRCCLKIFKIVLFYTKLLLVFILQKKTKIQKSK